MKIESVKIKEGSAFIKFRTEINLRNGNFLIVNVNSKEYYFKVVEIETSDDKLLIEARQAGYYYLLTKSNVDIRLIVGYEIKLIEDKELIKKIDQESCFI